MLQNLEPKGIFYDMIPLTKATKKKKKDYIELNSFCMKKEAQTKNKDR